MVEGFVNTCTLGKALMKLADQLDGIGYLPLTMTAEQITDSDISWAPERLACQTS
jgi:hypothetical protein